MPQSPEEHTLCLFGDCTVPTFLVSRPAQSVLRPDQGDDEKATPGPPSPARLDPPPVLIYHDDGAEEPLNPHVAARLAGTFPPDALIECELVNPESLTPAAILELVDFRFRQLDSIYNPCPGTSTADAVQAAIRALAESDKLRQLVLEHFLPREKELSGQVLAALFGHRVGKRTVQNYAQNLGYPLPWDNGTVQPSSPTHTRKKAWQFWEAYRSKQRPNLPPFKEAISILKRHAPDNPNPGGKSPVYSQILLDRLDPINGEADAFPVIATFLDEAGHLLSEKPEGTATQGTASAQELPTEETEPGAPAYDPNEASPEEPPLPNPDESGYESPGAMEKPEPPVDTVDEEDPLLFQIREIRKGESGALARSDDCWAHLLVLARTNPTIGKGVAL